MKLLNQLAFACVGSLSLSQIPYSLLFTKASEELKPFESLEMHHDSFSSTANKLLPKALTPSTLGLWNEKGTSPIGMTRSSQGDDLIILKHSTQKSTSEPKLTFNEEQTSSARITIKAQPDLALWEDGSKAVSIYVSASTPPKEAVLIPLEFNQDQVQLSSAWIELPKGRTGPVEVTLKAVDNAIADGHVTFNILTGKPRSNDPAYEQLSAAEVDDISGVIIDDDQVGITVYSNGLDRLETCENGTEASFSLVLNSQPTQSVSVGLMSTASEEGVPFTDQVTFEPSTWNIPQWITVKGVDDAIDDGDVPYFLVTLAAKSLDPAYNGVNPENVSLVNRDNGDIAGIDISPYKSLETTEAGGTDRFEVVLKSQPLFEVQIPFWSSDPSEGVLKRSESAVKILTFTKQNWNQPQEISIRGRRDRVADGNIFYHIISGDAASNDPKYNAFKAEDIADVRVTNLEIPKSKAGIEIQTTQSVNTSEPGNQAKIKVRLKSKPKHDVFIPFSSADPTEGTVEPGQLVFSSANWHEFQAITITGVNDQAKDGNVVYSVITEDPTSLDPAYEALTDADIPDILVTNWNDDFCDPVTVSHQPGNPMLITGIPGCTVDVYDATQASAQHEWVLIAQNLEIPPSGTAVVPSFVCQADKTYFVTSAGNPNLILNRFQSVPTLSETALALFVFFQLVLALLVFRKSRNHLPKSGSLQN